jgi:hypothetical protein
MNRLVLLLLCCAAWAAPYAHADDAAAMAVLRAGCTADVQRLCSNVQPGGGRILACLRQHSDALSDQCKQAAQKAMSMSGNNTPSNPPGAPPPPVPPPNPPPSEPAEPAPQTPAPSPAKHSAPVPSSGPGSYLLLKKVKITTTTDDHPGEAPWTTIEMLIPSTWDFRGTIQMYGGKTGCFSEAFSVLWQAQSPDSVTKFVGIPNYAWQYSDDPQELHNLTDPNRRTHTGGKTNDTCAVARPMSAEQYFRQMVLNDLKPAMTVESVEPYPALEQLVRQRDGFPPADSGNGGARIDAIRVRLAYQLSGKPMEAWYSVALVTQTYRAGRGSLYDIHAVDQVALGAPKGKLDGNEKLFKVVMSSIQPTPRFIAYTNKWIANYYQIQAQKEAKMDQIQADLINYATQTYLHMSANAQQVSDIGFHANEQNLRDVRTYRDPSTGREFELSNQYNHAWLNGANEYVMSDDPSFNPNSELTGSWNQLQPVQ